MCAKTVGVGVDIPIAGSIRRVLVVLILMMGTRTRVRLQSRSSSIPESTNTPLTKPSMALRRPATSLSRLLPISARRAVPHKAHDFAEYRQPSRRPGLTPSGGPTSSVDRWRRSPGDEIVMVDNASEDDTRELLSQRQRFFWTSGSAGWSPRNRDMVFANSTASSQLTQPQGRSDPTSDKSHASVHLSSVGEPPMTSTH